MSVERKVFSNRGKEKVLWRWPGDPDDQGPFYDEQRPNYERKFDAVIDSLVQAGELKVPPRVCLGFPVVKKDGLRKKVFGMKAQMKTGMLND